MQRFIVLILFFSCVANAKQQDWMTIYPVNSCKEIPIQYKYESDGKYIVKLINPQLDNLVQEERINNINDLSQFTENIIELSEKLCPSGQVNVSGALIPETDGVTLCQTKSQDFFSKEYVEFIKFSTEYIKEKGAKCEDVVPIIKLQEQITQLTEEDLIKYKKSKEFGHLILKALVGEETDKLIDKFHACGGKKGSDKFIKNLILIEAKNACIVPQMLSWDKAEDIATKISNDYKKVGLISLNKQQDKIAHQATMAFADKILEKEVDNLLGNIFKDLNNKDIQNKSYFQNKKSDFYLRNTELYRMKDEDQIFNRPPLSTKNFTSELSSKKRLKKFKDQSNIGDYVAYVFAVDAGIEIGQKAIPYYLLSIFNEKLPPSWSETKKEEFIKEKITPKAIEKYNKCMEDKKRHAKYGEDLSKKKRGKRKSKKSTKEQALLAHRLSLKDKFCSEYKEQCSEKSCDGYVNMLTTDDDATDTEVIQACVMQAITVSIEPLLEGIIKDKKEEFKNEFNLTDEIAQRFTQETWNTLQRCTNDEIKKKQNISGNVDIVNNEKPLQKMSTDDFQKIVIKCSDVAEAEVSTSFVDQIIINYPEIQKAYGNPEIIAQWEESIAKFKAELEKTDDPEERKRIKKAWDEENKKYREILNKDKSVQKISQQILDRSFKKCIDKQYQLAQLEYNPKNPTQGLEQKDPMLCSPIIEMNASLLVIEEELNNLIKDQNLLDNPESIQIIADYKKCGNEAIDMAHNDLGNYTTDYPLNNIEQSKTYIDRNPKFYNCVSNAIGALSHQIAGYQFDDQYELQKDKIRGKRSFKKLKPEVQQVVKSCFEKELIDQGTWSAFLKFNENDGLDKLQEKCSKEVEEFIIPKLIIAETHIETKPLIEDGYLLSSGQVGNVIFLSSVELRKKYGLEKRSDLSGGEKIQEYIGKAYRIHLDNGGTTDSFIHELSGIFETQAIGKVHENLMDKIVSKTQNSEQKEKFGKLDEYLTKSCLEDIYNRFMKNSSSESSLSLDELAIYIQTGITYIDKKDPNNFYGELDILKDECKNMSQFQTESDFYKSKFYSMIIKGQIYNKFKVQFKQGIMDSLTAQERTLSNPQKTIKQKYMTDMIQRMDKLLDKYLTEEEFDKLMFDDDYIMEFASNNIEGLLSGNKRTQELLTERLMWKMFSKQSNESFSDQFSQIMIEGNFGISGVSMAVEEGSKGKDFYLFSMGKEAGKQAAIKYFSNIDNIKNAINWKKLPLEQRGAMTTSIFFDAIMESQQERSSKKLTDLQVYKAVATTNNLSMQGATGLILYKRRINEITSQVTMGYKDYNKRVERNARIYAREIILNSPAITSTMTEQQLVDHIIADIKEEHMERNVQDRLLTLKHKGKTIEDKIRDDISNLGEDIYWRNTPEQKAADERARIERLKFKIENPLFGPKF